MSAAGNAVRRALESLDVRHAFGLPGERNLGLYDALRGSSVRLVVPTHELAAAFMAQGYARSTGAVGVVLAIPGPGLAYTLAGLVEAQHDSAPLLVLTGAPREGGGAFPLQRFDQAAVLAPVVKRVLRVGADADVEAAVRGAHELARSGEPGPVVVELAEGSREADRPEEAPPEAPSAEPDERAVEAVARRLLAARRPVVLTGQGAAGAAAGVRRLVARTGAAVLATTSGRGVVPEDDPRSLVVDAPGHGADATNALLAEADLVLALGCKLSHNGTLGYALILDPERLVHVDASDASLAAGGASTPVRADVQAFVAALEGRLPDGAERGWSDDELDRHRRALGAEAATADRTEPVLRGLGDGSPQAFFAALRAALPRDGVIVTDSGLHQQLARRHFRVLEPRTLLVPADFQSMGFGLPAAIGAAHATPGRPVVAVVGDGGFALSGLELLTAVRDRLPLTVVVLVDGHLGLIRLEQLARYGRPTAVETAVPDLGLLARSVGARHQRLEGDAEAILRESVQAGAPTLLELVADDPPRLRGLRAVGGARRVVRGLRRRG
ncbi:MAG TPA: thiamine pyrophosphate-binding protein [Gaiellaceae bacterium]|nr:thiamine pyrophosphate-binding protein [Gaiellaceae bacterium]